MNREGMDMATITGRGRKHLGPDAAWQQMPVKVFVRSDEAGNPTHLRFRLENGDDVTSVPGESEALRTLAEELLRATPPRGHCSRWFG